jgi:hypothetical protein
MKTCICSEKILHTPHNFIFSTYNYLITFNNAPMSFDQYHEPPEELSQETRTFARIITSLTEEAEAISWYEQRSAIERDSEAKAILQNAQKEEFKHFGMDLEFLIRRKPVWKKTLQEILFTEGDIVQAGEQAEKDADRE